MLGGDNQQERPLDLFLKESSETTRRTSLFTKSYFIMRYVYRDDDIVRSL